MDIYSRFSLGLTIYGHEVRETATNSRAYNCPAVLTMDAREAAVRTYSD